MAVVDLSAMGEREAIVRYLRNEAARIQAEATYDTADSDESEALGRIADAIGHIAGCVERGEHRS
jgi:hypothetical protein